MLYYITLNLDKNFVLISLELTYLLINVHSGLPRKFGYRVEGVVVLGGSVSRV